MKFSMGGADSLARPAAPEVLLATTAHAMVRYPASFEVAGYDGADLVLAYRGDLPGFRPNLVLTSVPTSTPLADASVTALLGAGAQHPAAQVYSTDVWDADETDAAPRGRRVVFGYRADDARDVIVHKWVWATGAHHVHLSASCLPSHVTALAPTFEWIAQQLRLSAPAAEVAAAAGLSGTALIDAAASDRAGFVLEDLAAVSNPPFRSEGPVVSTAALQVLLSASEQRVLPFRGLFSRAERDSEHAAQLTEAGWVSAHGRVTPEGAAVAETLRAGRLVASVKTRRGGRAEHLTAYAGRDGVLVLHGPTPTEDPLASEDLRYAKVVPPDRLPGLIAAWVGLRPYWPFSDVGERVSSASLERHLAAEDDAETEPWTELLFRDARGERYDVLSPSRGFLRVGAPVAGAHPVHADPSAALLDHILSGCHFAMAGNV